MYNEERKMRFLEKARGYGYFAHSVFRNTEPYEQEAGVDLCEMQTDALQAMLDESFGIRVRTLSSTISLFRSYVSWCAEQGYPVCDGIDGVQVRLDEKMKRFMIASPKHLQSILDKAFSPVEDGEVDCVYRCYLWMLFGGMDELEATEVKISEVNFRSMVIEHGGKTYEIYREAVPAFHMACEATEFVYKHPKYERVRQRYAGEYLLRGIRSEKIDITSIRGFIRRAFRAKGIELNYGRTRLSGVFYRAYELERMGEGVNFAVVAEEHVDEVGGSYNERYTRQKAVYTYKKDLKDDYVNWKRVFT